MVSMKDIAKACGVSVATVSKALSGQPDIGEQTRELICKTADSLGYMTNSAARALKTNRTYNIGVLFVDERRSGLAHEYFSAVLESLKVEAEANGYDITFINRNVGKKATTYLQHCQYRGVDGVVIACVDFDDPQVLELVNSRLPIVTIDHVFNNRAAVVSDPGGIRPRGRVPRPRPVRRADAGAFKARGAADVYSDAGRYFQHRRRKRHPAHGLPAPRRRQCGGLRRHSALKRHESAAHYLPTGHTGAWKNRGGQAHRAHRKAAHGAGRPDFNPGKTRGRRVCSSHRAAGIG